MVQVLVVSTVPGTGEAFQIDHIHPKPLQLDLRDNVEMQQLSVAVAPPQLPGEWRHSEGPGAGFSSRSFSVSLTHSQLK